MFAPSEVHFCKSCGRETKHIIVLVRKKSGFENSNHRKCKEFIAGLIIGWAVGPFLASMEDFSRHLICEKCGTKIVEG